MPASRRPTVRRTPAVSPAARPAASLPRLPGVLVLGLAIGIATATAAAAPAGAETVRSEHHAFRLVTMAEGLEHPWAVAFLPDGRKLVTERAGRLRLVGPEGLEPRPLAGVPEVQDLRQGGLLDVILAPDHADSGMIYLSYAAETTGGGTLRVARARLAATAAGEAGLEDLEVVFEAEPADWAGRHYGSRLAFGADGMLYVTVGERGEQTPAQDLGDAAGKTHRITPDGGVPDDNPFLDNPAAVPTVWTYGNRNAQGMAVEPATGLLWQHEHGPRGGDEVNLIRPGLNYGWPEVTHGIAYSGQPMGRGREAPGMEPPRHVWTPSIAPSGMAFYEGEAFPAWQGDILLGGLAGQVFVRLELDGTDIVHEERMLERSIGRIRDVRVGPDGLVYLLTDAAEGKLIRLEPVE